MTDAKWLVEYNKRARKQIDELSPQDRARVRRSITELARADNPTIVPGVKHLQGSNPKRWRQRQGDYRIIFQLVSDKPAVMRTEFKGKILVDSVSLHHTGY